MKPLSLVGFSSAAALLLFLAASVAAQTPASPVANAFREEAEQMARNLTAAADDMPVAKFGFKPTPAQISWGTVVLHVAVDNEISCAEVGGVAAPQQTH